MRDPLFDTRPQIIKTQVTVHEQQVADHLSQLSTSAYVKGVAAWWSKIRRKKKDVLGRLSASLSPLPFLPNKESEQELLNAFDHIAKGGASPENNVWDAIAARLIGQGLAKGISDQPTLHEFDRVVRLLDRINYEVWREFIEALNKSRNRRRWVQLLKNAQPHLTEFTWAGEYTLRELQAQHKKEKSLLKPDIEALWSHPWRPYFFPLEIHARLSALFTLDEAAFVASVEHLPFTGLIHEAIEELGISRNSEGLLAVIKHASPSFDDANGSWTGQILAILLPWFALDYGIELMQTSSSTQMREPNPERSNGKNNEMQSLITKQLKQFYSAIASRSDGQVLLKLFSIHIIKTQSNNPNFGSKDNPQWIALNVINELLDAMTPQWPREDLYNRRSKLLAEHGKISEYHSFLTFCIFDNAAKNEQWEWYCELLSKGDRDLIQQLNPFSNQAEWPFNVIGRAVATFPDVLIAVESMWESIYEQRFINRFHMNQDMCYPSLHLLKVARCALEWIPESPSSE